MWNIALLSPILVSVCVTVVTATRCYVCSGAGNSDCADTYIGNPAHEVECFSAGMEENGGCSKYKTMKEKVLGFYAIYIERSCGYEFDNLLCAGYVKNVKNIILDDAKRHVFDCSCRGDLCNSATLNVWSMTLYFIVIVMMII